MDIDDSLSETESTSTSSSGSSEQDSNSWSDEDTPSTEYSDDEGSRDSSGVSISEFSSDESGSEFGEEQQSNRMSTMCANLPEFHTLIYEGAKLTVLDSYLLLYQYALRYSLTKEAFSSLISLIAAHLL